MNVKEYIIEKEKFMALPTSQQHRLLKGSALHRAFCVGYWFAVVVGFILGCIVFNLMLAIGGKYE